MLVFGHSLRFAGFSRIYLFNATYAATGIRIIYDNIQGNLEVWLVLFCVIWQWIRHMYFRPCHLVKVILTFKCQFRICHFNYTAILRWSYKRSIMMRGPWACNLCILSFPPQICQSMYYSSNPIWWMYNILLLSRYILYFKNLAFKIFFHVLQTLWLFLMIKRFIGLQCDYPCIRYVSEFRNLKKIFTLIMDPSLTLQPIEDERSNYLEKSQP